MTTKQRLILLIPLTLALAAGVVAWVTGTVGTPQADTSIVEELLPAPNTKVPQQAEVGIDLQGGWDADLVLNGVTIPKDQMARNEPLARYSFRPGAGKEIEVLQPGQNCAVAKYWPVSNPGQVFSKSWCFSAS